MPKHAFTATPESEWGASNSEAADRYPAFRAALLWYRWLFGVPAPSHVFNVRGTHGTTAPFLTPDSDVMHILVEYRTKTGRHDDDVRGRKPRARPSPATFLLDKRVEIRELALKGTPRPGPGSEAPGTLL